METSSAEASSAYTRLKREAKEQETVASTTVLKVWFTARYENISYTAHQSSVLDMAGQILPTLPGILTHTVSIEGENCKHTNL